MRAQGTDIWLFVRDGWPHGYVIAENRIEPMYLPTMECTLDLDHKYDLADFGILVDGGDLSYFMSFELAYKFWHQRQLATCVVAVPVHELSKAREVLKEHGWPVVYEYLPGRERD